MSKIFYNRRTAAIIAIVAVFLFSFTISCSPTTERGENIDLTKVPRQRGENIIASQTKNGNMVTRLEAAVMEKYETDSISYDLFPNGFDVYSYNDGNLETQIHSKVAKHTTWKNNKEQWVVYGDVEITNFFKGEKMFTDTLYWDREEEKIYTDCFVKMSSPRGYMQGYGLSSDEMARNAIILRPFDSYGKIGSDSIIGIYVDSVNFIGPMPKINKQADLIVKGKDVD